MLSYLIYSFFDRTEESQSVFYLLSFYTWASGLFDSVPDYAIIDALLVFWTVLYITIAITILAVSDATYKKSLVQLHYKIAKTFYDVPSLVTLGTFGLLVLTTYLCYKARYGDDDATLRAVISAYTFIGSIILQKQSNGLAKLGPEFVMEIEQKIERIDIANYKPPPKWLCHVATPINLFIRPEVVGAENIPTEYPALYVSNHALLGIEMAPFIATVYLLKNIMLRGITDKMHFGQLHGEIIRYFGGVNGTRENVDVLMETRQNVLVYPGGGHEILKPSTIPRYQLMWKERLGFARKAIKYGYPLVPVAAVGTEDMMDILFDIPLDFLRKDLKLPVIAPILPHRVQKVYFWFGEPISTTQYNGDWQNDDYARELRDKVKAAVEAGMQRMKERQANDPNRYLLNHIANATKDKLQAALNFCKDPFESSSSSSPFSSEDSVPAGQKVGSH